MNSLFTTNLETYLDWNLLNETRTGLSLEDVQKAAKLSQSIRLPEQRWQVYISGLAVFGFERWLKERAPDLEVTSDAASIWQPELGNFVSSACNIQVGDFKICLLTANNISRHPNVPFGVFDVPSLAAQFYVLMQVIEEEQQVAIFGFLSYQEYQRYQQNTHPEPAKDWTYSLPISLFNLDTENLLLNLRCLDASAVQLPATTTVVNADVLTALKKKLKTLKPQLKTQPIWNLLTPAEGVILLSHQDLIKWIEQGQSKIMAKSSARSLININNWLQNQVDRVAQELGWMLMPSLSPSQLRLRDAEDNFEMVQTSLQRQGINLPPTAKGAYIGIDAEHGSLRLYAIAWVLPDTAESPGWILLTILAPQPGSPMPQKLTLEVCDEMQILFDETLDDTSLGMLYAQVMGEMHEQFWVTVTADEVVFEMPALGMEG
ncbi:DUF1822 family protein [Calothrix sp. PCC 6303]|uniref:DUF1822 family protein n=1 Tax=Calothrix sp. PCC 6303 TaxID=1170562 RepID=UPI0002A01E4A|nr:DUF1822 family protein [Calothrix sp. PCC 6303]AFZ03963.1 protein of unknown function DUF1822 [Calothrix sp. PCC 6303]